ncbi:MAG: TIGR04211 family SH3 domain-containing protein, partial [bacterium]|nr:TIGR04211 family SH3 domain-containing protein [bacterium]
MAVRPVKVKTWFIGAVLLCVLALWWTSALAKTAYVADRLIVTVRGGKGSGFNIVARLTSDDPVVVLQEDGAYSKIRTAQGVEGWVSQQYITTQRPKAEIIKELNGEIDSLASRIG